MLTFLGFTKRGRLGNQMFRVASTIGISIQNNTEYAFPEWKCHRAKKDFGLFFARPLPKIKSGLKIDGKISEKSFSYSEIIVPNGNFTLSGFFQTERYFEKCDQLIRSYFAPKKEVINYLISKYGNIFKNSCSLHIRRTDYLRSQSHHPVLDLNYYHRAVEIIKSRRKVDKLIVFSDDINWCKSNLGFESIYVEGNKEIEDLFLMSMCSNHIIANSSFSWWGAWLNSNPDKLIVAPSLWFGPALKHHDTSDIVPQSWIRIKA